MSQACNKLVPTEDDLGMERKNALMRVAAGDIYLASAQVSFAGYALEQYGQPSEVRAHLIAASFHVARAITSYEEALNLLQPEKISEEAKKWLEDFDYDRFFGQQVSLGIIPNRRDIWSRIVDWTKDGYPANSVQYMLEMLHKISKALQSGEATVTLVRRAVCLLGELQVFGVMVAVLNEVAPLDPYWATADLPRKYLGIDTLNAREARP